MSNLNLKEKAENLQPLSNEVMAAYYKAIEKDYTIEDIFTYKKVTK